MDLEKEIEKIKNLPDSFWDKIIDDEIKNQKEKYKRFKSEYLKGFNAVIGSNSNSWMSDDYLYSSEIPELQKISEIVGIITVVSLDFCKNIEIETLTEEYFRTDRCYIQYDDYIFEAEQVSGQGTFERLTLLQDDVDIKLPFIKIEDVLIWIEHQIKR